ncbi:type II toxin-antitoxin system VapC family toxin [candidate division KSB1 bacterium]|nr:type II toxin-antitoxin system VapC family toxin [candidate division KSB1 bacterium]
METGRVLADSSLLIEFFRKKKKGETWLYKLLAQDAVLYISAMTHYELLCGAKSPELYRDTTNLLQLFETINFSEREAKTAASIYQDLKKQNALIGTLDVLIAATAIEHNLPIATHNRSHFERIPALQIISQ